MSRIGRKPILIPQGVEVKIKGQEIEVKSSKGGLCFKVPEEISVVLKDSQLLVSEKRKTKRSSALWGLVRAILENHVTGVSKGFEKKLEVRGIGYKVAIKDKALELQVGFSHLVNVPVPDDLNVAVEKNIIIISGIDKQKVGEFAAKIRRIRPPEPYKGKGIRYLGEKVRKKEGKKAVTAE